ncbi:MAG: glycosyltransferase, partial [Propionibacteriaceae bacterium]|nr:glycosyltransferase [Propionibacteriaceae bacterium]
QPGPRWQYAGTVLDAYETAPREAGEQRPRKILVTVGGEQFPFDRLFDAVATTLPEGIDVLWQAGETPVPEGLPGRVVTWLDYAEMERAVDEADLVITHAGVGSVLTVLSRGKLPLILARRRDLGEHVDDHQHEWASIVTEQGLAVDLAAEAVDAAVHRAMSTRVIARPRPQLVL